MRTRTVYVVSYFIIHSMFEYDLYKRKFFANKRISIEKIFKIKNSMLHQPYSWAGEIFWNDTIINE